MEKPDFQIADIISESWRKAIGNAFFFAAVIVIYFAISGGLNYLQMQLNDSLWSVVVSLVDMVVIMVLVIGITKISLLAIDAKALKFPELYKSYRNFFDVFIGGLLYGLIVFGGLILLIVPGIIWGIKYSMYMFYIIDKNMGPVEALVASGKATQGYKGQLFLMNILLGLINFVGALALFVGLFITIPLSWLARAKTYRVLESRAKAA